MSKKAGYQGFTTFIGEKNGRKKRKAKRLFLEKIKSLHGDFEMISLNQLPETTDKGFAKNPKTGK